MKRHASTNTTQSINGSRIAYTLYLVLVVYQLCMGELEWAVSNLGIALIFDPFDASVKWSDRLRYQKVWLLVHLTLTFVGLGILLFITANENG